MKPHSYFFKLIFKLSAIALIAFGPFTALAAAFSQPAFHCENDTVEIKNLLIEISPEAPLGQRIATAAEYLKGRGLDRNIYTDSTATLRINIDEFYPMSFVNSVLALSRISGRKGAGWRAYNDALTDLSCRQGTDNGFPAIMWHVSDWAGDNIYRGNIKELTDNYPGARDMTVSLDYLSRHRDEFAVLENQEIYDSVRMLEMGFRSHKVPYLPRQAASSGEVEKDLRDGDIIALVNDKDGTDYYTIGILVIREDGPHLIHFDSNAGKVTEEAEPLKRYLNKVAKYIKGFRWLRLN